MKKYGMLLLFFIALLLLSGCISSAEYEAVKAENKQLREEVATLKARQLRHFADLEELVNWRNQIGTITNMSVVNAHIELQRLAFNDGYITSIDLDEHDDGSWGVSLTVIAGDKFYYIVPDDLSVKFLKDLYKKYTPISEATPPAM